MMVRVRLRVMQGLNDPNRELLDAGAFCRQLVGEGSVYAFLADHRGDVFADGMFEDLFPSRRGRPSTPAGVMASAMILKELEGLSDRQAADALRCDIRWKVACGLALDDSGVHYTVFTYWRQRLAKSESPDRIADAVRAVVDATGVLSGKKRRALDSTLLDDAVATQDTVTQLVSQIRRVRRLIPQAATVDVAAHDYDASGKPVCAWDDPDAKEALVSGLVNDALAVLGAVADVELDDAAADAVGLLALVLLVASLLQAWCNLRLLARLSHNFLAHAIRSKTLRIDAIKFKEINVEPLEARERANMAAKIVDRERTAKAMQYGDEASRLISITLNRCLGYFKANLARTHIAMIKRGNNKIQKRVINHRLP